MCASWFPLICGGASRLAISRSSSPSSPRRCCASGSAYMGMALSSAFQALRQRKPVDLDKVLRRIRQQGLRELTLTDVTLPNGAHLGKA